VRGFLLLGIAYRTYEDVLAGQEVLVKNGLMEHASIFGQGAYLGPGLYCRLSSSRRVDGQRTKRFSFPNATRNGNR